MHPTWDRNRHYPHGNPPSGRPSGLTPEQRERIEFNKARAAEIRRRNAQPAPPAAVGRGQFPPPPPVSCADNSSGQFPHTNPAYRVFGADLSNNASASLGHVRRGYAASSPSISRSGGVNLASSAINYMSNAPAASVYSAHRNGHYAAAAQPYPSASAAYNSQRYGAAQRSSATHQHYARATTPASNHPQASGISASASATPVLSSNDTPYWRDIWQPSPSQAVFAASPGNWTEFAPPENALEVQLELPLPAESDQKPAALPNVQVCQPIRSQVNQGGNLPTPRVLSTADDVQVKEEGHVGSVNVPSHDIDEGRAKKTAVRVHFDGMPYRYRHKLRDKRECCCVNDAKYKCPSRRYLHNDGTITSNGEPHTEMCYVDAGLKEPAAIARGSGAPDVTQEATQLCDNLAESLPSTMNSKEVARQVHGYLNQKYNGNWTGPKLNYLTERVRRVRQKVAGNDALGRVEKDLMDVPEGGNEAMMRFRMSFFEMDTKSKKNLGRKQCIVGFSDKRLMAYMKLRNVSFLYFHPFATLNYFLIKHCLTLILCFSTNT